MGIDGLGLTGLNNQDIKDMQALAKSKSSLTKGDIVKILAKDGTLDATEQNFLENLKDGQAFKLSANKKEFQLNDVEFTNTTDNYRSLVDGSITFEKAGLLSDTDKEFLTKLNTKINSGKNYAGIDSLSKEEISQLKGIIDRAIAKLSDKPVKEDITLSNLKSENVQKYEEINTNFDKLMNSCDAAIHKSGLSTAASGRSIPDMQKSIKSLEDNLTLVKTSIASLKSYIAENPDDKLALYKLSQFNDKFKELNKAYTSTVSTCKGVMAVHSEMLNRMSEYSKMSVSLIQGGDKLKTIESKLSQKAMDVNTASLEITKVKEKLVSDIKGLIEYVKTHSDTLPAKTSTQILALLNKESETLQALSLSPDNLAANIKTLEGVRANIISTLDNFPPKLVDQREVAKLKTLDKDVKGLTSQFQTTAVSYQKEYKEFQKKEVEAAKNEGEMAALDKFLGEDSRLAYGSNITLSLGVEAALGAGADEGKVGVKVGGGCTLTIGKYPNALGKYQVAFTIDGSLGVEAKFGKLIELEAKIKASYGGGMIFDSPEEVRKFADSFKATFDAIKNGDSDIGKKFDELADQVLTHTFVKGSIGADAEAGVKGLVGAGAEAKVEGYVNGKGQGVRNINYGGHVMFMGKTMEYSYTDSQMLGKGNENKHVSVKEVAIMYKADTFLGLLGGGALTTAGLSGILDDAMKDNNFAKAFAEKTGDFHPLVATGTGLATSFSLAGNYGGYLACLSPDKLAKITSVIHHAEELHKAKAAAGGAVDGELEFGLSFAVEQQGDKKELCINLVIKGDVGIEKTIPAEVGYVTIKGKASSTILYTLGKTEMGEHGGGQE